MRHTPKVGERFQVVEGSGLDTGKTGKRMRIADVSASVWRRYPHCGTPQKGWVPVWWDDGEMDAFPLSRMRRVSEMEPARPHHRAVKVPVPPAPVVGVVESGLGGKKNGTKRYGKTTEHVFKYLKLSEKAAPVVPQEQQTPRCAKCGRKRIVGVGTMLYRPSLTSWATNSGYDLRAPTSVHFHRRCMSIVLRQLSKQVKSAGGLQVAEKPTLKPGDSVLVGNIFYFVASVGALGVIFHGGKCVALPKIGYDPIGKLFHTDPAFLH